MIPIIIYSNRFILKELSLGDVSARYLSWINGPSKSLYIEYSSQNRTLDEVRNYVIKRTNDKQALFLGIFTRDQKEHIGNIKYEPIDFKNKTAIMGVLIGEENWRGKGVASEVIKSSSEWLGRRHGISQICLGVDSDNVAAIKAYEKIGFKSKKISHIIPARKGSITMTMTP